MSDRTITNRSILMIHHDEPTNLHLEQLRSSLLTPNELTLLIRTGGIILWGYIGSWGILTGEQMWKLLDEWLIQQSPVGPGPSAIYEGVLFENTVSVPREVAQILRLRKPDEADMLL